MATRNIKDIKSDRCPRCNASDILKIEGTFIRWLKCPKCKYTKVVEKKEKEPVKVVPLIESQEKPIVRVDIEK